MKPPNVLVISMLTVQTTQLKMRIFRPLDAGDTHLGIVDPERRKESTAHLTRPVVLSDSDSEASFFEKFV